MIKNCRCCTSPKINCFGKPHIRDVACCKYAATYYAFSTNSSLKLFLAQIYYAFCSLNYWFIELI